ncbi:MAG: Tetratricopeptide 2 repeat protein [Candidatus Solibacter sp.]|nr:Tetratricopeptide 2 repeat protein [Candidatus Solibacter sp.]
MFRLLRAEILLNSTRAEEVVAQLDEPMPSGAQFAPLAARKLMLEGQADSILGHAEKSAALLAEAHRAAEASNAGEVLLDIENIQGARALRSNRYDDAERFLRSALQRARALRAPYPEASVLVNLGMIRFTRHRYDEAAGFFEEASRRAGPQLQVLYSVAQSNLATCYSSLGDYDRAIRIYAMSVAQYERSGAKFYLQRSLGQTGHTYLLKGDLKSAVPFLQKALSIASEMRNTADAASWAGNLSAVYSELGDWRNAASLNEEAIRLRTTAGVNTLFYNQLNSARIASGRGEVAEAVRLYSEILADPRDDPSVIWEAHEGLGDIAVRQHQPAEAARQFETALNVVEKTRSELLRTEFKLPFLTRLMRFYEQYVDTLLEQQQIEPALAVADSSRAQVLAERYEAAPARRLAPDAFQALARQTNSVLLCYWLGAKRSHVWVVTGREIHYVELPPEGQIEPLVREYQDAIEQRLADPLRKRIPAGDRLYEMLITPLRTWIPPGSRVILTPDGVLHGLNFESLPLPGETPRFLIQDVTLALAPSLALLAGKPRHPVAAHRLLLLGDPLSNDPGFPRLPQAEQEIAGVTRRFGGAANVVLRREGATPDAWSKAAPGGFSAIHFTAHAVANRESPLDSAVLLSGGKLYARDVMEVPLTADLVTFSACRGVGLRTYSGEGLVGFAWAFLHAGAHNVIAGLWDVNDQSTATLMDALYGELAAGKRPADALRAAKLAMIASPGNLHKPYYWAPFQLYTVAP